MKALKLMIDNGNDSGRNKKTFPNKERTEHSIIFKWTTSIWVKMMYIHLQYTCNINGNSGMEFQNKVDKSFVIILKFVLRNRWLPNVVFSRSCLYFYRLYEKQKKTPYFTLCRRIILYIIYYQEWKDYLSPWVKGLFITLSERMVLLAECFG